MPDFRCSFASVEDEEPIIGTAPTDPEILLVESPGPWGREALTGNRLPALVREHLGSLDLKVFLLRRYDGSSGPGTHVFHARATEDGYDVRGTVLDRPEDLLGLDLAGLPAYDAPLWLVCTNGKRDRCCAEVGRPVAGLLTQEWPDGTWETTHLGGHRFSGTLLALPSGLTLGRLDTGNALAACEAIARGEVPVEVCRGRAGRPGLEQARELHLLGGGDPADELVEVPGPARRQSCGDDKVKGTTRFEVTTGSRAHDPAPKGVGRWNARARDSRPGRGGRPVTARRGGTMTTTPDNPLGDDEMTTEGVDPTGVAAGPGTDADGTDGDSTDSTDGDSTDADGTDGDSTDADGTDGDSTDADGTDGIAL